jgi:hypothetical protein
VTARKPRESDIQSKCLEKFEKAFPDLKIIRINSGVARGFGHSIVHLAPTGTPDLVIPSLNLWVELKKPGKQLSSEQVDWCNWAVDHRVPYMICDNADDLISRVSILLNPKSEPALTADALRCEIKANVKWSPSFDEYGYQAQLENFLVKFAPGKFTREMKLSETDRVDFFVGGIAVELKLKCPTNEILRQLARYSQHESVREILILSATRAPLQKIPATLNGKPVRGLHIGSSI